MLVIYISTCLTDGTIKVAYSDCPHLATIPLAASPVKTRQGEEIGLGTRVAP